MNINNKKVIIITGSNRGIGLGIVKALSEMNDFIIILTSRDKEKGEKVWLEMTEEIPKLKNYLFYHQLDITCLESIQIFLTFIKEKFIKIDILVNNAGVYIRSFTTEAFDLTFNTNFYSTVNFTEEIIQKNLLNQGGKIIFISSSFGKLKKLKKDNLKNQFMNNELTVENLIQLTKNFRLAIENKTVDKEGWARNTYSISKLCISLYCKILSQKPEIKEKTIHVFSLCPGWVKTDMGGENASRTIIQGIKTPLYLINLNLDKLNENFQGNFFYDEKVISLND